MADKKRFRKRRKLNPFAFGATEQEKFATSAVKLLPLAGARTNRNWLCAMIAMGAESDRPAA